MKSIECVKGGVLYSNPKPHVSSRHAYFPSVVCMNNNEMLATIVLGEAFESTNLNTYLCRSKDQGETWTLEGPLYAGTNDRLTSNCSRMTSLGGGKLVIFMIRHDRSEHPDEGLTNPVNLGFVPTELLLFRSDDYGHTWSAPQKIETPLEGPCFELCSPITVLRDNRWIIPTMTWPDWQGSCPNGFRMVGLVSEDQGHSWTKYWNVMHEPEGRVFFWESKICELSDGRLLAAAWGYDDIQSKDRPNQYAVSQDGGMTWSKPQSTGLLGQTLTPLVIEKDHILSIYRRVDKPGLWANISHMEEDRWINDAEQPLWGHQASGLISETENMAYNFSKLRFGAPSIARLNDGSVFVAFWCYEDNASHIRWFKLRVS